MSNKERVTFVEFNREHGVQVKQPGGSFLRHIQEKKGESAAQSDFHILGITDILLEDRWMTIVLKDGIKRHFPYESISSFTVE